VQLSTRDKPAFATRMSAQFLRFGLVGFLCFLGGLASVYLLTDRLHLHYVLSMAISLLLLNLIGWLLNRHWTFGLRVRRSWAELARYLLVSGTSFALTLVLLALLVSGLGLNYLVASAIVALLMTALNFTAHRLWSLRVPDPK
jgi:putative flippase GtrA